MKERLPRQKATMGIPGTPSQPESANQVWTAVKLTQDQIESLNDPVTTETLNLQSKTFQKKKFTGPDDLLGKFY
jgi:hypothetical protein